MWRGSLKLQFVIAGAVSLATSSAGFAATIYVDVDATGANNGTSWADAYTDISTALNQCGSSDQLWVADGTYRESQLGLLMTNGCDMYGGFHGDPGGETAPSQADPATNETILSGDLNADDPTISDNAEHVVTFGSSSITCETVMDGFTITAGYADGTGYGAKGGGMLVTSAYPMLSRLVFNYNHADGGGGAMSIISSDLVMDRCEFHDNDSYLGGAIHMSSCDLTLANSLFYDNEADDGSGDGYGGAMFLVASDPNFINLSIGDNSAEDDGGGIYNDALTPGSSPIITNGILWGNTDSGGYNNESSNMHSAGSSSPVVTYTDWGGHTGGTGNKNVNPGWAPDYHPSPYSLVINAGLNSAVYGSLDLDDETRIKNLVVDMGAFEILRRKPQQQ